MGCTLRALLGPQAGIRLPLSLPVVALAPDAKRCDALLRPLLRVRVLWPMLALSNPDIDPAVGALAVPADDVFAGKHGVRHASLLGVVVGVDCGPSKLQATLEVL